MTIKQWVFPPVSLSLKEIQNEFGCVPLPPTTTTTISPQTSSTTSTSTTSTSTSTSTTSTLPPLTYDPIVSIQGFVPALKPTTTNTYTLIYNRGPDYRFSITGGPPNASFTFSVVFTNGTNISLTPTLDGNGNWTSTQDTSSVFPLGLFTVTAVFTPGGGQSVINSNTRILEVTVVQTTTSSTTTTSTTTTISPAVAAYYVDFLDPATNQPVSSVNEGGAVKVSMRSQNVSNGTQVQFTISGISTNDYTTSLDTGSTVVTSGTFTVGGVTSFTMNITDDAITEGAETITIRLGTNPNFLATGTLTINDTSVTQTGTAWYSQATGSIETLTGSAVLPASAVTLMFSIIGAGGSGGGGDNLNGGSGGGGGLILGMVRLPATATTKTLKAGIGLGGESAASGLGSNNLPQDYGKGGKGFSFLTGTLASASGGSGATDGPSNYSGRGGGGGGSTGLFVTVGTNTIGIASAGGGGGGGGASMGVWGGHAANGSGIPIDPTGISSLDGATQIQDIGGYDGGGGGGGGGGLGAAGQNGRDSNRGNQRALGGTAGRPVQNTYFGLAPSQWSKWEYYQPNITANNGKITYGSMPNEYTAFLRQWGVWDNNLFAPTFDLTVSIEFPVTGTYYYTFNADNLGTFQLDGATIASVTSDTQFEVGDITGSFTTTAGQHNVRVSATNINDVGIVGLLITNASVVVFSTLDFVQNRYASVSPSLSRNRNFFGYGGAGADSYTSSINGTCGAIAVYWTTDPNPTWNANLLPELPLPSFALDLPSTVSSYDNAADIDLYITGRSTVSSGYLKNNSIWCTFQYNNLGALFQIKVEFVSGDDVGLCPQNVNRGYIQKGVWTDWSIGQPIRIGCITTNTVYTVAKVSIRRKTDNVVQFEKNITFDVTYASDGASAGGG